MFVSAICSQGKSWSFKLPTKIVHFICIFQTVKLVVEIWTFSVLWMNKVTKCNFMNKKSFIYIPWNLCSIPFSLFICDDSTPIIVSVWITLLVYFYCNKEFIRKESSYSLKSTLTVPFFFFFGWLSNFCTQTRESLEHPQHSTGVTTPCHCLAKEGDPPKFSPNW